MNIAVIIYILGYVLEIEGALMMLPFLISLMYREGEGKWFLIIGLITIIIGAVVRRKKPDDTVFYLKEGCITTAASWVLMSIVGAFPFVLSGVIPEFTNAFFEVVSGFTTTGASILNDVEGLPVCCKFWRSFTHWIGGMGVLVFLLAVIPLSGGSNMNLMRAESPGPSVGKLVPKVRATARILYLIYFGMSAAMCILLLIGRMPPLEAVMITFGTAGTGGFGVRNSSCGEYSAYLQWVIGIFMVLFGMNFNAYYLILLKKFKEALHMEEIHAYVLMVLSATTLVVINLSRTAGFSSDTVRGAFFQVASLSTSTGFATLDFDVWPDFSRMILMFVMVVGACAGSTGGGLKVSRALIGIKAAVREIGYYLHPKSVKKIKMDGRTVEESMVSSVGVYFIVFIGIFVISFFLVMLEGFDLLTGFSAVLTTLNNMGPGFNLVGPTRNFAELSILSKYVLMFDMLAGRLELFPMILLLHPGLWKETIDREKSKSRKKHL